MRAQGAEHRLWLKQPPTSGVSYAAELNFDDAFEIRAYEARRLWRALNGRPAGPEFHALSPQRRRRLTMALRALDARAEGKTYRAIADILFADNRVPQRDWKTHDLRNRAIRLVRTGLALMRGGYRALLRQARRKK